MSKSLRRWSVTVAPTLGKGVFIAEPPNNVVFIPQPDIEEFMKHVFSAATGREFMGAHYGKPREDAERDPDQ